MKLFYSLFLITASLIFATSCGTGESNKETTGIKLEMKYKDISAEEFKKKMKNNDAVIIDVRTDGGSCSRND